jgi:hypothetical protein
MWNYQTLFSMPESYGNIKARFNEKNVDIFQKV